MVSGTELVLWRILFFLALLAPALAGAGFARLLRRLRKQWTERNAPPDQSMTGKATVR